MIEIFVPTEGLSIGPLLFLMGMYGFILMKASHAMADGSELLLDVYGPGIVGGILIPILGAVPDALMILMSGMGSGTTAEIAEEIQVGLGTLVGSTTMLLSLAYSASIYLSSRQLGGPENRALTRTKKVKRKTLNTVSGEVQETLVTVHVPALPKEFSWTRVGATGLNTSYKSAIICMLSSCCFLLIQLPALVYGGDDNAVAEESNYALFGLVVALCGFLAYLVWTYTDKDAIEIVHEKQMQLVEKFSIAHGFKSLQALSGEGLDPFHDADKLFAKFDGDGDGSISFEEMAAGFKAMGYSYDSDQCRQAFNMIDADGDGALSVGEFKAWVEDFLLQQYILSLPAPADASAALPSTLPAAVSAPIAQFLQADAQHELALDLPPEQRYPLHFWAAGVRDLAFALETHTRDAPDHEQGVRTLVITKRYGADASRASANLRPQPRAYEAGYPVWACASDALMAFYKQHLRGSDADAFDALFAEFDSNKTGGLSLRKLEALAAKYSLPLTPTQVKFAFYSRDTDLDHRLGDLDLRGLLESLVDAHSADTPELGAAPAVAHQGSLNEQSALVGSSATGYSTLDVATDDEDEDEPAEEERESHAMTPAQKIRSAALLIVLGTAVVTLVSDPMCEVISALGDKMGVPSFYISFIITPLVSNASEIIASLQFAAKKTDLTYGLTVATLYSAATMNATLCLAVFLGIIYGRGLPWTYLAETITVMCVMLLAGLVGLRQTQKMWHAGLLAMAFPAAIALIYVLNKYVE